MDVQAETAEFEAWFRFRAPVFEPDLEYRHEQMAKDPFTFLRGTYYLWTKFWPTIAKGFAKGPQVLAIGDVHLENFGTWRDADGRLVWGLNDFDDAAVLPYTNDLIRLATSVRLARKAFPESVKTDGACAAILDGYRNGLETGGEPFVLEERHSALRSLAMRRERDPVKFWKKFKQLLAEPSVGPEPPPLARKALLRDFPSDVTPEIRFRPRVGTGSLGRPRYVAVAAVSGSLMAREVKFTMPPTSAWATGESSPSRIREIVDNAVRCADPFYRPGAAWIGRRIGPRCSRIELSVLATTEDVTALMRSMGAEIANIHLGTNSAAKKILADLDKKKPNWLSGVARSMAKAVKGQWLHWRELQAKG